MIQRAQKRRPASEGDGLRSAAASKWLVRAAEGDVNRRQRRVVRAMGLRRARSYLDLLCQVEVEHVVLWLSGVPMACRWFVRTSAGDLRMMLGEGAPTALREGCLALLSPASKELWDDIKPRLSFCDAAVLLGAAEALRAVVLTPSILAQLTSLATLTRFCRAARQLGSLTLEEFPSPSVDMRTVHERLFRLVAHTVTELCVHKWMGRACGGGGGSALLASKLTNLREMRLKCHTDGAVATSRFWRSVGCTLRVLYIKYARRTNGVAWDGYEATAEAAEVKQIRAHCRHLTTICISPPPACRQELFDTLVSYGGALEYVRLGNPNEEQAQQVAVGCPNARVELALSGWHAARILSVFGARCDEICLYGLMDDEWTRPEFRDALASCVRIRRFDAFPSVAAPFACGARPELRILALYCQIATPRAVLRALAHNTGALRKVALRGFPPHPDVFRNFILANPYLQKLALALQRPPPDVADASPASPEYYHLPNHADALYEYYAVLLDAVAAHPALCRVDLRAAWVPELPMCNSRLVRDACTRLRHRKIAVVIDRLSYLPVQPCVAPTCVHML